MGVGLGTERNPDDDADDDGPAAALPLGCMLEDNPSVGGRAFVGRVVGFAALLLALSIATFAAVESARILSRSLICFGVTRGAAVEAGSLCAWREIAGAEVGLGSGDDIVDGRAVGVEVLGPLLPLPLAVASALGVFLKLGRIFLAGAASPLALGPAAVAFADTLASLPFSTIELKLFTSSCIFGAFDKSVAN